MTRETGIVDRYNDAKGFGYIKPDRGGKEVFVHFSALSAKGFITLTPGQRVVFNLVQDPKKGPCAEHVFILD